ncbi:alpha/beta hydrolase-fold protein [Mucilaginibacter sp. dw_454]|uniref:alpha/beta hydrolase-fold protein n=1 Tax=Mucilaginibacter sp. dw_454 TaxID=2720079 RepID=UPI001BD36BA1|nr:alpha/beta hydrolase-fold protein [Mucilaginibacter sp. dw_454]
MKTLILTCALSIILLPLKAQTNNSVVIGAIDSIHSKLLNEQRKIWVHVPASASLDKKKKYPVVYVLDAERCFTGVVGMIDYLSSVNGNDIYPEMIVVGIPNTNRTRDLTPTRVSSGLWITDNIGKNSGGGETFTAFIEHELVPHIDSIYPTFSYRVLLGHSFGGIMAINALVHHKNLFRGYIVIDPSMWWDNQKLLHETGQTLQNNTYPGVSLFLGMANTLPPGMDTASIKNDTTSGTIHSRSILQLRDYVMGSSRRGLNANFKYYNEDSHGSVSLLATYDALHFIFKDYALKTQDSYFTDPAFPLAPYLKDHFENLTSKYGITAEDGSIMLPPVDLVNNLGFFVLGKKEFDKAEAMFRMNIINYPTNPVAYTYLGDLYLAKGDKKNAIASYKKALSLKESPETRKKLGSL